MDISELVRAAGELGFPIAVAVYLLVFQSKQLEKMRIKMTEVKIGLYLILATLNKVDEYEEKVQELKEKRDQDD